MSQYNVYLNKATEAEFVKEMKPNESMPSCISRVCREWAQSRRLDDLFEETTSTVNMNTLVRDLK